MNFFALRIELNMSSNLSCPLVSKYTLLLSVVFIPISCRYLISSCSLCAFTVNDKKQQIKRETIILYILCEFILILIFVVRFLICRSNFHPLPPTIHECQLILQLGCYADYRPKTDIRWPSFLLLSTSS